MSTDDIIEGVCVGSADMTINNCNRRIDEFHTYLDSLNELMKTLNNVENNYPLGYISPVGHDRRLFLNPMWKDIDKKIKLCQMRITQLTRIRNKTSSIKKELDG